MNNVIVFNQYESEYEIGETLYAVFLRKILSGLEKPDTMIFYNSGVKLLTTKSDVITILEALQASGVDIIACGMCVGDDQVFVGRVTSMDEITCTLMKAKKVITV